MTRHQLAISLRVAADQLDARGIDLIRLDDAKAYLLAALNDIDRMRDYGRPGAGIDALLGKESQEPGL